MSNPTPTTTCSTSCATVPTGNAANGYGYGQPLGLSEEPETVQFPSVHYIYVERKGDFMKVAGEAWTKIHGSILPQIKANKDYTIEKYLSMYNVKDQVYRAGVTLSAAPTQPLPEDVQYYHFPGGKYSRFQLMGSFSQLPYACRRATEIMKEKGIEMRTGSNDFHLEDYLNDPSTTPVEKLTTHILLATA